ncbi:MAG TPA: Holliday junction resolvase RuvX [Nitrospiraceae bacterium]|nr:Holliday junction resolvase RuvX [Nitrospiraceae bacterium]
MRVMGLDVGDKYIGLAVSDTIGITAQGLTTVERDSRWTQELMKIIEEYEVTSIVVGIPKMLNGSIGVQGEKVLKFIEELKGVIDLPIFQWDERLSTVAAERVLLEADLSRKKRKGIRDKVTAVIILQGYLDSQRSLQNRKH